MQWLQSGGANGSEATVCAACVPPCRYSHNTGLAPQDLLKRQFVHMLCVVSGNMHYSAKENIQTRYAMLCCAVHMLRVCRCRYSHNIDLAPQDLADTDLPPFEACVQVRAPLSPMP
jgi:hypothetical protein